MIDLLQTILIAITLGSLYALIALGYTMVYGILKLINFAHGDVVVLGAWGSYTLAMLILPALGVDLQHVPWWFGPPILVGSMLFCGAIGFLIERLAYRPLRGAPRLNVLITAIGVSLLLQNVGQLHHEIIPPMGKVASGTASAGSKQTQALLSIPVTIDRGHEYQLQLKGADGATAASVNVEAVPGAYAAGEPVTLRSALPAIPGGQFVLMRSQGQLSLPFGAMPAGMPALVSGKPLFEVKSVGNGPSLTLSTTDGVIIFTATLLLVGLEILVYRTKLGLAMRAVSFNTVNAGLMGVPVDKVISFTFVLGSCLAAAAGFLLAVKYGQIQQPAHALWVLLGLKAFVAAVVGGIGNIRGAVIGGFLIAFIEQLGARYISSAMTDVYVFALLIIVLLVKPNGLLGSTTREKV